MQFEHFPYWASAFFFLLSAAAECGIAETASRGKGSWYKDRELLGLRGAFWALSLVCLALSIACILA